MAQSQGHMTAGEAKLLENTISEMSEANKIHWFSKSMLLMLAFIDLLLTPTYVFDWWEWENDAWDTWLMMLAMVTPLLYIVLTVQLPAKKNTGKGLV